MLQLDFKDKSWLLIYILTHVKLLSEGMPLTSPHSVQTACMLKVGCNQVGGLHSKNVVMQANNSPGAGSPKRPEHILLDPITDKAQRTVSVCCFFSGSSFMLWSCKEPQLPAPLLLLKRKAEM